MRPDKCFVSLRKRFHMPAIVSEKKLAIGLVCLAVSSLLWFNTTLVSAPVRVSEKGIAAVVVAVVLMGLAIRFLKGAIWKV